jgi:hypothetical protein
MSGPLESAPDTETAVSAALRRGAHPHPVDGNGMRDKASALDTIAAALSFPDYFGRNLDALYDCLTDLSWLPAGEHVLIWSHPEVLRTGDEAAWRGVSGTLADAVTRTADHPRRLRVQLVEG